MSKLKSKHVISWKMWIFEKISAVPGPGLMPGPILTIPTGITCLALFLLSFLFSYILMDICCVSSLVKPKIFLFGFVLMEFEVFRFFRWSWISHRFYLCYFVSRLLLCIVVAFYRCFRYFATKMVHLGSVLIHFCSFPFFYTGVWSLLHSLLYFSLFLFLFHWYLIVLLYWFVGYQWGPSEERLIMVIVLVWPDIRSWSWIESILSAFLVFRSLIKSLLYSSSLF